MRLFAEEIQEGREKLIEESHDGTQISSDLRFHISWVQAVDGRRLSQ